MNRPPLEVADIVRCAGQSFVERSRKWINGNTKRCCWPSRAAAPPRWVDIAISARTADILPSLTTRAATGTAPSVRATPACAGSRRGNESCCPPATCTSSSHCRGNWLHSRLQNKRLIYNLLFHASAADLAGDRPRSSSPRCRDRLLQRAPYLGPATATSSPCPLRGCRRRSRSRSLPAGSPRAAPSSFPSRCSAVSSAASLSPHSRPPFMPAHSSSTDISYRLRNRAPSPRGCGYCSATTGSSTPNAFRRARTCAALSRRLHPSRRHFQQQVGCSLRGQRHLSLARLRSRQQEAADDSARR
jgi:hypothetical protein